MSPPKPKSPIYLYPFSIFCAVAVSALRTPTLHFHVHSSQCMFEHLKSHSRSLENTLFWTFFDERVVFVFVPTYFCRFGFSFCISQHLKYVNVPRNFWPLYFNQASLRPLPHFSNNCAYTELNCLHLEFISVYIREIGSAERQSIGFPMHLQTQLEHMPKIYFCPDNWLNKKITLVIL